MSDKETLVAMGFDAAKVAKALKVVKGAGLQPAMDWLIEHADDIETDDQDDQANEPEASEHAREETAENANAQPEVVLSPAEKAERLRLLQIRIAERKEEKRLLAIQEDKDKEKVRRTTGQELQAIKDKLARDEMAQLVAERKREKDDDRVAKNRVLAMLEADKKDRQRIVLFI